MIRPRYVHLLVLLIGMLLIITWRLGMACLLRVKIRKDVLDALKPSLTEVPHKTVASHIVWRLKVATVGSLS